jgi:dTMP kinase
MFISLEGIDGSGKSTQGRQLVDALQARGVDCVLTREPGGAPGAEEIRRLLVEGAPDRWSAETEILLFNAARRDHLERTIRPALAAGKTVITDRFADSTRVYQGATRGDLRGFADAIHSAAIGVEPDLTLILDMDPGEALARSLDRLAASEAARSAAAAHPLGAADAARNAMAISEAAKAIHSGDMPEDRFETFGPLFQKKLRAGFRDLAAQFPARCRLIDASRAPETIAADILAAVLAART